MKKDDTKLRILALKIILKSSPRALTVKQIQAELKERYNISVERKSLYDDFAAITRFYNLQVVGSGAKTAYIIKPFPT